MNLIVEDQKYKGFHQYVFWNNKFFLSKDIEDTDLHIYWQHSRQSCLDAEAMSADFMPSSCVIASHITQANMLFKKIKRSDGRYVIVFYSRDGGIDKDELTETGRQWRVKGGHIIKYKADLSDNPMALDHELMVKVPDNVDKMYCSNINFDDDKMVCYPYGVSDNFYQSFDEVVIQRDKLAYANFNVKTNPSYRIPIWKFAKQSDWINCSESKSMKAYITDLFSHKYVLCPKGNGVDTMRMWESFYCGAVPIVNRSGVSSSFSKDLPIIEVDDWNLDKDYLEDKYEEVISQEYKWEIINKEYWRNIICEL